jgi:hypothetical protein
MSEGDRVQEVDTHPKIIGKIHAPSPCPPNGAFQLFPCCSSSPNASLRRWKFHMYRWLIA